MKLAGIIGGPAVDLYDLLVDKGSDLLGLSAEQRAAAAIGARAVRQSLVSPLGAAFQAAALLQEPAAKTELRFSAAQTAQGYAPTGTASSRQALQLDGARVSDWIPQDPRLASFLADRARFQEGGSGWGTSTFTQADFGGFLKAQLMNNPLLRLAFEADFQVKIDFGVPTRPNELAVVSQGAWPATAAGTCPPLPAPVTQSPTQGPTAGPPAGTPASAPGVPPPGASASPLGPSYLDPNLEPYRECLLTLLQNWEVFDTAIGVKDEYLTRGNLEAMGRNPAASAELKQAATFLLQHSEYFNRLEMAAGVGGSDGIIGKGDVVGDLGKVNAEIASYGAFGAGTTTGPGAEMNATAQSNPLQGIVNDPLLSLEDKIEMLLGRILGSLDGEIEATTRAYAEANDPKSKSAAAQGLSSGDLQIKLQRLIEKRKQMFDLLSNMSMKFSEMAKTALGNLARA